MWKLDDKNIVLQLNDGSDYYPLAEDIFSAIKDKKFTINNFSYESPIKIEGLRFSKIGLPVQVHLNLNEQGININIYAIKNDKLYSMDVKNKHYLGYVLVDMTWYYTLNSYKIIEDILVDLGANPGESISYFQYMNFIRDNRLEGLNIVNNVLHTTDEIKHNLNDDRISMIGLQGTLFHYQKIGCQWLYFMTKNKCGSILGDEMGLGKTLQIISLLGMLKEHGKRHFLVIAPVSLLANWKREIEKFYPSLNTLVHHGSRRTGYYKELLNFDIVIMSYSNVSTDMSMLDMIKWDVVVLDEAQNIKTPDTTRTLAVKKLKKDVGIAVSGTPFENHITDVWSIVDFVMPGYMGNLKNFQKTYEDSVESARTLEQLLSPIMIRRCVSEVAKDLPQRVDIPQPIIMRDDEAVLYEEERKNVCKNIAITAIQKLRMYCTHPSVYDESLSSVDPIKISNKYARLCEIIEEVISNGEKVLVFTSFNKMIDIMVNDIKTRFGVYVRYINGPTKIDDRQKIIDDFSDIKGSAVLVLNPKAAGTGLNITSANHVIHYNLEWNPAVEDQASARAYRRGQKNTVFIYRLYYVNTVEEIMNERIQNKRDIFKSVIVGNNGESEDQKDLLRSLNISPFGGVPYE